MKMYRTHICQSIEGALRNWKSAEWKHVAKENNITVEEAKDWFWKMFSEGKRVLPIGEECEDFSYQTGCPGHEIKAD